MPTKTFDCVYLGVLREEKILVESVNAVHGKQ